MEKWNGTKGSEFKIQPAKHIGCTVVYLGDFKGDIEFWHHQETKEIAQENARLTCDALITVNECGLLPSELLKERNELLEMIKHMHPVYKENSEPWLKIEKRKDELINKISK